MSIMCVYQDCLSVKYPCGRMAFFRLPSDDRRSTWIRNSGNKSLLNIGLKAQRFFCENHFRKCDISNQFNRKLLRRDAVPIEHNSLRVSKQDSEESSIPIKNNDENIGVVECFEENSEYQNLYEEIKLLDSSASENPADASSGVPYRLLTFYDDDDEKHSAATILVQKANECVTKTNENPQQGESLEIYLEENSNNNQVDSSTFELEEQNDLEIVETLDDDLTGCAIPLKKIRRNEMETLVEAPSSGIVQVPTPNNNSYEEDKHYALSLVGYFQRMPQGKKALAKLKILQYLTELEIDLPTTL